MSRPTSPGSSPTGPTIHHRNHGVMTYAPRDFCARPRDYIELVHGEFRGPSNSWRDDSTDGPLLHEPMARDGPPPPPGVGQFWVVHVGCTKSLTSLEGSSGAFFFYTNKDCYGEWKNRMSKRGSSDLLGICYSGDRPTPGGETQLLDRANLSDVPGFEL